MQETSPSGIGANQQPPAPSRPGTPLEVPQPDVPVEVPANEPGPAPSREPIGVPPTGPTEVPP
jgi:hypothetical protein